MPVFTLCQKLNIDSTPSTTKEATRASELLGQPEPPVQDQPTEKEEQKKKKLAQHKEHRLKSNQGARRGIRVSERAMFHNFNYQMTSMRKLIKAQRKKTVYHMKALLILQASTVGKITGKIVELFVNNLQVPPPPHTPELSPSRKIEKQSPSPAQESSPERQVKDLRKISDPGHLPQNRHKIALGYLALTLQHSSKQKGQTHQLLGHPLDHLPGHHQEEKDPKHQDPGHLLKEKDLDHKQVPGDIGQGHLMT